MTRNFRDLISENYETAVVIQDNIVEAESRAANKLFEMVENELKPSVGDKWDMEFGEGELSLTLEGQENHWIMLEGHNNNYRSDIYFGIYGDNKKGLKFITDK